MRILIAEDDEALSKFVRQGLESEHYNVHAVEDGDQALSASLASDYDLIVLDLNLPKLDGVGVLRQLRIKKPSLPILILTQRNRVEDRVQCLDTGADDYLGKPFSFSELSARIRALIRRSHLPTESVLTIADLRLDRVQRIAERAGLKIELTAKEFSLLEFLMRNAGRDVTRSMIIEHVWNLTFDTTTKVVDVYINYAFAGERNWLLWRLTWERQPFLSTFSVWHGGRFGTSCLPAARGLLPVLICRVCGRAFAAIHKGSSWTGSAIVTTAVSSKYCSMRLSRPDQRRSAFPRRTAFPSGWC